MPHQIAPMLKRLFAATCLLWAGAACSASHNIPGAGVSFDAPDGFSELTTDEIRQKWISGAPPKFAVGNARRTTTIAYDLKPHKISANQLGEVKTFFEKTFERIIPGLAWQRRELIEHGGQTWILFEMTSNAIDTDIHNLMLFTPYREQLLIFNFNSTRQEFPALEAALRRSLQTIRLESR